VLSVTTTRGEPPFTIVRDRFAVRSGANPFEDDVQLTYIRDQEGRQVHESAGVRPHRARSYQEQCQLFELEQGE
jgi:hypothetical protein